MHVVYTDGDESDLDISEVLDLLMPIDCLPNNGPSRSAATTAAGQPPQPHGGIAFAWPPSASDARAAIEAEWNHRAAAADSQGSSDVESAASPLSTSNSLRLSTAGSSRSSSHKRKSPTDRQVPRKRDSETSSSSSYLSAGSASPAPLSANALAVETPASTKKRRVNTATEPQGRFVVGTSRQYAREAAAAAGAAVVGTSRQYAREAAAAAGAALVAGSADAGANTLPHAPNKTAKSLQGRLAAKVAPDSAAIIGRPQHKRPPGRPPNGKVWDAVRGDYSAAVPSSSDSASLHEQSHSMSSPMTPLAGGRAWPGWGRIPCQTVFGSAAAPLGVTSSSSSHALPTSLQAAAYVPAQQNYPPEAPNDLQQSSNQQQLSNHQQSFDVNGAVTTASQSDEGTHHTVPTDASAHSFSAEGTDDDDGAADEASLAQDDEHIETASSTSLLGNENGTDDEGASSTSLLGNENGTDDEGASPHPHMRRMEWTFVQSSTVNPAGVRKCEAWRMTCTVRDFEDGRVA
jgi:hypothetical protein